jgi:hypothetical protein
VNIGKEGKAFVAEPIETPDVKERTADAPERVEELVPVAVRDESSREREAVTA